MSAQDDRAVVALGRMPFASGAEVASANPSLETLKRERLHSRLVGNFEWSYYQRRFDGARADVDRPGWHVTAAVFVPTQGGFEESTNLSMPKVQVGTVVFTRTPRRPRPTSRAPWRRRSGACLRHAVSRPPRIRRPWSTTPARSTGRSTSRSPRLAARTRASRRRPPASSTPCSGWPPRPAIGMASRTAPPAWPPRWGIAGLARPAGRGCVPATCGPRATAIPTMTATARSSRCCPRRASTRCRRPTRR